MNDEIMNQIGDVASAFVGEVDLTLGATSRGAHDHFNGTLLEIQKYSVVAAPNEIGKGQGIGL